MQRACVLGALVILVAALAAPAGASVVVPVADADLAAQASAVVIGRVTRLTSFAESGRIFTAITIAVDDTLKGDPVAELTLKQPGGTVGGRHAWIGGSPEFRRDEKVLVFLGKHADGTPRVLHLYQGKFTVVPDFVTGDEYAYRDDSPAGVRILGGAVTAPAATLRRLRDVADSVRAQARREGRRSGGPLVSARAPLTTATQETAAFTFLGTPSRWFEPDAGQPVRMLMNGAGEPAAPTSGFDQVRAAYSAWNAVAGSLFRYVDGGFTTLGGFVQDRSNVVSFRDPGGDIDPPVNCSGVLAQGGFYRSTTETRVVNGTSFFRILEGDLVFADGWTGCGVFEVFANMAEIATHELGHVLGLGHSADPDATMYGFAHFDGRAASLRADDMAAVRTVYPARTLTVTRAGTGSGTVSSTPAGISCGADCSQAYPPGTSVTLTATPAAGSTFGGWSGGCAGTGGCTVSLTADATVTATFAGSLPTLAFTNPAAGATVAGAVTVSLSSNAGAGSTYRVAVDGTNVYTGTNPSFSWNSGSVANGAHTLSATVTDSLGRTGSASRAVSVQNGTPTGTLRVVITAPAANATVSGTAWAVVWVEGAAAGSRTFTLRGNGAAVNSQVTTSSGPVSMSWNTTTAPNGPATLSASVSDSAGATGSTSLPVTVQNGSQPAPLTVSFGAPAAGATLTGTVSVTFSVADSTAASRTFRLDVDGATVSTQTTAATSVTYAWNTTTVAAGSHTLTATVTDSASRTGSTTRTVSVSNPPPPLTVSFSAPAAGATVTGTANVTFAVSGSTATSRTFRLDVDGTTVSTQTTAATSVTYAWNTTTVAAGSHTLTAMVTDSASRTGSTTRTVSVSNTAPPPLTVSFSAPAAGATVSGTVNVTFAVADSTATARTFRLDVDGATVSTQTTAATSVTYAWNTTTVAAGSHMLTATVTDSASRTGSATRTVSVSNTPPATGGLRVVITQPTTPGTIVRGTTWTVIWVENAAAGGKTFTLSADGTAVSTQATTSNGPVSLPWNTTTSVNGSHTIRATVTDSAGTSGTASVTVTVAN